MSLIHEDGTGVVNAESYISVADADTYFTDRSELTWMDLDVAVKEASLRKATDYIELRYAERFRSSPLTTTQSLSFPRYDFGYGVLPATLKKACAEYALIASTKDLAPAPVVDDTNRLPTKTIRKVGPIDKENSYATRGPTADAPPFRMYPKADGLMKPMLVPAGVYR